MSRGKSRPFDRMRYEPVRSLERSISNGDIVNWILEESSAECINEWRTQADHKIRRAFDHAVDPRTKKGTRNYVLGQGSRIGNLVHWVDKCIHHRGFVMQPHDLPCSLRRLKPFWQEQAARQVRVHLFEEALVALKESGCLWFDGQDGSWNIVQSYMDEYRQRKLERKLLKVDQRPYHGRPRGQTRRRNIPAGTSIGVCAVQY
jgi:hypothetical protein